jgi:hypothetical protein
MKIEIEHIKDNDDGSCNVVLNTDNEANMFLIRYGLVAAIKDAIKVSQEQYSIKEENPHVENLQAEIESMREILSIYDEEMRHANEQIVKLQKTSLSEERIFALYRRTMDWRQFARDIEKEHGVES